MIHDFKLEVVMETRDVLSFYIYRTFTVRNAMAVKVLTIGRRFGRWKSQRVDRGRRNKI